MHSPAQPHPHHHVRFYIVMVTLIVGAIFLLLLMNDKGSLGLTNLAVLQGGAEEGEENQLLPELTQKEDKKAASEVDFTLSFDEVPEIRVEEKATAQEVEVTFRDFSSKIYVNDDRLELNNVEQAAVKIEGFEGAFVFDAAGLSLDGIARKLQVNGISLSSRGSLEISFKDLEYDTFIVNNIELQDGLHFPRGNGELKVANKLAYALEQDKIDMEYFNGKINVNDNGVSTEGVAKGIQLSGALLNVNVR